MKKKKLSQERLRLAQLEAEEAKHYPIKSILKPTGKSEERPITDFTDDGLINRIAMRETINVLESYKKKKSQKGTENQKLSAKKRKEISHEKPFKAFYNLEKSKLPFDEKPIKSRIIRKYKKDQEEKGNTPPTSRIYYTWITAK